LKKLNLLTTKKILYVLNKKSGGKNLDELNDERWQKLLKFFQDNKSNYVFVDGLGVGDVGEIVLRDRQMLAEDGMFVIVAVIDKRTGQVKGSPDIILKTK
jgi:mRNA degradation ribonuclease J1/J2